MELMPTDLLNVSLIGRNIPTISRAPDPPKQPNPEEEKKKRDCMYKATAAAVSAFAQTFVPLPGAYAPVDPTGSALDTAEQGVNLLKNPGVRAVVLTETANAATALLPLAADFLDFVPVLGQAITVGQALYGGYEGVKAYSQAFDRCMGGG
jgi:hypothetical protein